MRLAEGWKPEPSATWSKDVTLKWPLSSDKVIKPGWLPPETRLSVSPETLYHYNQ